MKPLESRGRRVDRPEPWRAPGALDETGAKYEYMDLQVGGKAEGLSAAEIRDVARTFSIDSPWLQ